MYYNSAVYDSDFLDPNVVGGDSRDDDTDNFDCSGGALGYVCAHGVCDDVTTRSCSTSADCPGGYCPGTPPSAYSTACINNFSRRLVTSSLGDKHSHNVFYGPGNARWGEDPVTGGWAGAGTNGDNNVVFLINSCGARAPFLSDLFPLFAGTALITMIMPMSNLAFNNLFADAILYSTRGNTLATNAVMNPHGAIKDAWNATQDAAPATTPGSSCPNRTSDFTYGGGHGIAGCGASVSMAMDWSPGDASWDLNNMSWYTAQDDTLESRGNSYWYWSYYCNYDCNTYPFQK
jgi:hypothetical protein